MVARPKAAPSIALTFLLALPLAIVVVVVVILSLAARNALRTKILIRGLDTLCRCWLLFLLAAKESSERAKDLVEHVLVFPTSCGTYRVRLHIGEEEFFARLALLRTTPLLEHEA